MVFRKRLKISVLLAAVGFFSLSLSAYSKSERQGGAGAENGCLSCHQKSGDKSVELYLRSTHAMSNITCNRCHGGDLFATDKQQAHGGRFIGQPATDQLIAMCGSCHRPQLEMFKRGSHYPERKGQSRLDCAQCHGAHTVGAPSESFSLAYLCAGCHGLEYLPELPEGFRNLMSLADEVQGRLREARISGRPLSEDEMRLRREIRRSISEIVHPTDVEGGLMKIPAILRLGEEFKQAVKKEKRSDREGIE
jgi:nitrate/TMAO reductase-like tetraheme cytochrome c subunit